MRNFTRLLTVLCVALASHAYGQFTFDNLSVVYDSTVQAAPRAVAYGNLRLYPILAKESFLQLGKQMGNYTPLEQALSGGKVLITEFIDSTRTEPLFIPRAMRNVDEADTMLAITDSADVPVQQTQQRANNTGSVDRAQRQQYDYVGNSGTVNTLYIENISADTVFLMAGEVVKGGKQDRVVAQDMVLPPNSGKVELPVFCVEKGRWQYRNDSTSTFNAYFQMSSSSVRGAVNRKSQTDVWGEVDRVHSKNNTGTETSTYTALASSEEFLALQKAYNDFFGKELKHDQIIGLVAVSADRIVACDLFASPALFQQHSQKILQSYISEAITHGGPLQNTDKMVQDYLQKLMESDDAQEKFLEEGQKGNIFKDKQRKLHISSF